MFEQNEEEVEKLMRSDSEFRVLYHLHRELDSKVRDAEIGALPMDDVSLQKLKKEKLRTKDKLTVMWSSRNPITAA